MGTQRDAFGQVKEVIFSKFAYFSRYCGGIRMRLNASLADSLSASFLMRINEMTLSGAKIPSFRAVLAMPYKPRRLPESPKSVSDRHLSLFTQTSLEKV